MENSIQELRMKFDKTEMKDLLIHQIASHMQQHWNADAVGELFLESTFNFVESNKTKAEVLYSLMQSHKAALKNESALSALS